MNLTTGTTKILVVVETLPEREERLGAGLSTRIEQDTHFGVQDAANGGEEPSVGVNLLAVLLLQAEHHLDRGKRAGAVIVWANQLLVRCDGQLCGVFELLLSELGTHSCFGATHDMSDGLLAVNVTLHDTILVDTHSREEIKSALVAGIDAVENQADDDFLPSRAALVPELGLLQVDNIANILHDTVQSTGGQDFVFVVVGNGDEQLGVAVVHGRTQIIAILEGEVVGVARCGRVWQLSGSLLALSIAWHLHRMCVNSSLPLSRSLRYLAWMAFWMALGTG